MPSTIRIYFVTNVIYSWICSGILKDKTQISDWVHDRLSCYLNQVAISPCPRSYKEFKSIYDIDDEAIQCYYMLEGETEHHQLIIDVFWPSIQLKDDLWSYDDELWNDNTDDPQPIDVDNIWSPAVDEPWTINTEKPQQISGLSWSVDDLSLNKHEKEEILSCKYNLKSSSPPNNEIKLRIKSIPSKVTNSLDDTFDSIMKDLNDVIYPLENSVEPLLDDYPKFEYKPLIDIEDIASVIEHPIEQTIPEELRTLILSNRQSSDWTSDESDSEDCSLSSRVSTLYMKGPDVVSKESGVVFNEFNTIKYMKGPDVSSSEPEVVSNEFKTFYPMVGPDVISEEPGVVSYEFKTITELSLHKEKLADVLNQLQKSTSSPENNDIDDVMAIPEDDANTKADGRCVIM